MKHRTTIRITAMLLLAAVLTAAVPAAAVLPVTAGEETLCVSERPVFLTPASDRTTACGLLGLTAGQLDELVTYVRGRLDAGDRTVDVRSYDLAVPADIDDFWEALYALLDVVTADNDYKLVDLINASYYSRQNSWVIAGINVSYLSDTETAEVEAAAAALTGDLEDTDLPDVIKALVIHDRLAVTCRYDTEYATLPSDSDSFTAYGCLVNRVCVCEGYAKAYAYLLGRVGIHAKVCRSTALGHAWNIVTLDGVDYYADVTWDDPMPDTAGRVDHDYFLCSFTKLHEDHRADDYERLPEDTRYDRAFWTGCTSGFQLLNGSVYYVDGNGLNCWDGTDFYSVRSFDDLDTYWQGWQGAFYRTASDGQYLYVSFPRAVYRFDPAAGTFELFCEPDMPTADTCIFGMYLYDDTLYLQTLRDPNTIGDESLTTWFTFPGRERMELSGSVTSFGSADDPVTLTLTDEAGETVTACTVTGTEYCLRMTEAGEYRLTVTKANHASRSFDVTIGDGDVTLDVSVYLMGDVNMDGKISTVDAAMTHAYVCNRLALSGYQLLIADVCGDDGLVTTADAGRINSHVRKQISLW